MPRGFCPNDHTLLRPTRANGGGASGINFDCPTCGYRELRGGGNGSEVRGVASVIRTDPRRPVNGIAVIEGANLEHTVRHPCSDPRCSGDRAYMSEIKPTRFNDEQDEVLFECTTCGRVERVKAAGN
jgi:DNA-directed RNA polymerase subunit M/transcription elongation factor TFIIS